MPQKSRGPGRLKKAEAKVQERVESIDQDIEDLEKLLQPYERIKEEINKLRAARRTLLGGTITGSGTPNVRQQDVAEYLMQHPGSQPGEIAKALGVEQTTISSHLYRGKGSRFLTHRRQWWVKDPKNGINTIADIIEER